MRPAFLRLKRCFHPDLKIAVEHLVADEDNVAIAYTATGTQESPSGHPYRKKVKARGMQIAKFNSEAKITERWGSSGELGILQQIGAIKPTSMMDRRRCSQTLLIRSQERGHEKALLTGDLF